MNNNEYKILESRNITSEEYNLIINILDKYKMDKTLFITNSETLVLNKIDSDEKILNGYNAPDNIVYYNDKSNIICELLRVASCTRSPYQGICIKPNRVYPKTMLFGLNAGITDLFLELGTKKEGFYPFEKICAKVIKYAYGTEIYNCYFMNNDSGFRMFFNKYFDNFFTTLDEYHYHMIFMRMNKLNSNEKDYFITDIKVLITMIIEDLLKVTSDSGKDCKTYLLKQLKSKTMKPIYDIIGEYKYEDYHNNR